VLLWRFWCFDEGFVMSMDRYWLSSIVLLMAAGCSKGDDSDSGLMNALAQIRAVNLPLADGDPVRQPELGLTAELRHNIADSMAPRAFGDLHDGTYRLHAHDFQARIHPDRLELTTPTDPQGITIRLAAWGRGGSPAPVGQGLLRAVRDEVHGGIDLLEVDRGGLLEWFDGATRGLEHGWTVIHHPRGEDLLSFEIAVDAAVVDISVDAKRAWLESDEGTTWNVTNFKVWDADAKPLEFWLEPTETGFKIQVDDLDAVYPVTVDPWYTTTSTEIQNTTSSYSLSGSGSFSDSGHAGHYWDGTGTISGYQSDLTSESGGTSHDFQYGTAVIGIGDTNGDGAHELLVASYTWLLDCSEAALGSYGSSEYGSPTSGATWNMSDCSNEGGRLFVYNGREGGLDPDHVFTARGDGAEDHFARSLITDADFNGDGHKDLLVGIPHDDDGGSNAGSLRVFPGSSIGLSSAAVATIHGASDSENLGLYTYRFGVGDLNGDGYDDLVVGIPTDDTTGTDSGKIIVYMGSSSYLPTYISTTLTMTAARTRVRSMCLRALLTEWKRPPAMGSTAPTPARTWAPACTV
jgi:hypothetical protein